MYTLIILAAAALSGCYGSVYLQESEYPLRTATCQFVMEKSSSYTGKWIATGRGSKGDEYHSCLTRKADSDLCLTWNNLVDCYDYTHEETFPTENFHECSEEASNLNHTWCFRALEARWANCIYVFNKDSQFYKKWVIAHSYDDDSTYCYNGFGNRCISFHTFVGCQDTADLLQRWYEGDGEDRLTKKCSSVDEDSGWCYAAFLLLNDQN